jgi:excisionase family DNA binding protein
VDVDVDDHAQSPIREEVRPTATPRNTAADRAVPQRRAAPHGTLGGSNRLLSARQVADLLGVPESTVRLRWRAWNLPAYKIGKHLRWKERDVHAWIDNQTA